MPRIARLWTDLELESSQFTVGLRKAVAESTAASGKIQKQLAGIKGRLDVAAGAIAATGILSAARAALDYASSLGEVSQQLGVAGKDLQEYRYAATQAGISQEAMDRSLAKLTVTMGKAREGSKAQAVTFRELNGLIGKDILASAQSAGDAIPLIADALAKVEDPTKRARLEVALFGKAGQQLDTLLKGGSSAVNGLRDAAQKLGIVLSDRQIQNADDTADKLAAVKQVLEANIASVVADNATSILGLANALSQATTAGMNFVSNYPRLTAALAGAAAGARMGGPVGAAIGGTGGFVTGSLMSDQQKFEASRKWQAARALEEQANSDLKASGWGSGLITFGKPSRAQQRLLDARKQAQRTRTRLEAGISGGSIVPSSASKSAEIGGLPPPPPAPGTATPPPSSSGGKHRGASGESAAEKAERARLWYEEQIARSKLDELSLQDQIVGSYRTRYAVEMARIEADKADFARDLAAQKGLTNAQRAELTAANDAGIQRQTELADREKFIGMQRESFELFADENEAAQESVRAQIDMARTVSERRAGELRLLELQKQAEAAQIELILATESTASAAWQNAKRRQDALNGVYSDRAAAVKRDTMGPMARYLDQIPQSARETAEAYESIAARGLDSFTDSLVDAAMGAKSLKDTFKNMADGIVSDLLRIAVQQQIVRPLARSLFGNTGEDGSTSGGLFGRLFGGSSGIVEGDDVVAKVLGRTGFPRIPGLAGGGSFMVGERPGIDRNVLSINGRPRALVSASERIDVSPPRLRAANDQPMVVQLVVEEGGMFQSRVESISQGVSVETVSRAQATAFRKQRSTK